MEEQKQPKKQISFEDAKPDDLAKGEINTKSVTPLDNDAVIELLKLYKKLRKEQVAREEEEALTKKFKKHETDKVITEPSTTVDAKPDKR